MDPSKANIQKLCTTAFNSPRKEEDVSQTALKSIANILLLHKEARQVFVDTGFVPNVAARLQVDGEDRNNELICARLLFLLTYDTDYDFGPLFGAHQLAQSIHHNISFHSSKYREKKFDVEGKPEDTDSRALTESLKLLFNLTRFYPEHVAEFTKTIPCILNILERIDLPTPTFQAPVTNLINALLNLDLLQKTTSKSGDGGGSPLFPDSSPSRHLLRLVQILEAGLCSETNEDRLEITATPLVSVLRRVNEISPEEVRAVMQEQLLPSPDDRSRPLGKSNTLPSRLLRLSNSPSSPQLREAISSLLFELSDKDVLSFIRNVGYGYAAGYLMSHDIKVPDRVLEDGGAEAIRVDGQEVNPITGQRRDMEWPVDIGPEMTDEEKEREAERLFVLFERLKATGVVNVVNPVEQAQREGRFEEVD